MRHKTMQYVKPAVKQVLIYVASFLVVLFVLYIADLIGCNTAKDFIAKKGTSPINVVDAAIYLLLSKREAPAQGLIQYMPLGFLVLSVTQFFFL